MSQLSVRLTRAGALVTLACAVAAFAPGCSTNPSHRIETEVRNPEWQGEPFRNVLIIAAYEDRAYRISSESIAADEFIGRGLQASPSYDLIRDVETLDDAESVRQALQGADFDAIITIATVEANEEFDFDAYQAQYSLVRLLGSEGTFTRIGGAIDYYESGRFVLDLAVWDTRTLDAVWHATTASYSMEESSQQARTVADFLLRVLQERGLI